jgi:hypothetical protein
VEGLLSGISSGATIATKFVKELDFKDKITVAIQPDSDDCYLSTPLFCDFSLPGAFMVVLKTTTYSKHQKLTLL